MDQDAMVNVNLPGGWRLIERLTVRGFPIEAAFWAKLDEHERWNFYVASPVVEQQGFQVAVRQVLDAMREDPEWGIDINTVSVLSAADPLSKAAAEAVAPGAVIGASALKPVRRMTRILDCSFGRHYVEAAFIYPPWEPGINPVG
jgi:hypothetical protein